MWMNYIRHGYRRAQKKKAYEKKRQSQIIVSSLNMNQVTKV